MQQPVPFRFDHELFSPAQMHEAACAHGEERFSRYGECKPTWVLNLAGRLVWIETPWESAEEKYKTTNRLAFMLQQLGGTSYTLLVEAYVATQDYEKGKLPKKFIQPGDRPKNERDEVLMVLTKPRGGEIAMSRYLISPRKTGPNFLGPRVDESWPGMGGDMTDLFERELVLRK